MRISITSRIFKLNGFLLAVLLAVAAGMLANSELSTGNVPSTTVKQQNSASDTGTYKRVSVTCPIGYRATGGGHSVFGQGRQNVRVLTSTVLLPPSNRTYLVDAVAPATEDRGQVWSIAAIVVCAQ